jgi:predicted transcriptional regulator
LELGRAGYAIVGADRASGWLQAQKRIEGFFEVKRAEIYVTVIPDESGRGSHLQLTDNSHAEDDADRLRTPCASSVT